ncbi:MAG: alpha/beta hydrolase [Myxococcales bacterium]|nr:alpha/beta hydrolase [Myxococcales bacterium]
MRHLVANLRAHVRRRAGGVVIDATLNSISRAGRLHPNSLAIQRGVDVIRDVPYLPSGDRWHRLDVYRPTDHPGPHPVLFYVHGGGFRILSKDTHWMMGLQFARRGFTVFSINYRLAPASPYPAALQDAFAAAAFVRDHAADYGADPSRFVLAGESAGGNIVCAMTAAHCYRRPEPWARAFYDLNLPIEAVMPAAGLLQVTDPDRFRRRRPDLPAWLMDRITEVSEGYLHKAGDAPLADPLLIFEAGAPPERPIPPMLATAGTRDPILDDTRRLGPAIERLGGTCDVRIYPGGAHAFHAVFWRDLARQCWADHFAFLDRHVPR